MSKYRRPPWLLVIKPGGLISTVEERTVPGEQQWIIRGEPLLQSLELLVWGPVAALVSLTALTIAAISMSLPEQEWTVRASFIAAFLIVPVLAWIGTTYTLRRVSQPYLAAERAADRRECRITIDHAATALRYQPEPEAEELVLPFYKIRQLTTEHAVGKRETGAAPRLLVETDEGPLILLNEWLGTTEQKNDLARKIGQAVRYQV